MKRSRDISAPNLQKLRTKTILILTFIFISSIFLFSINTFINIKNSFASETGTTSALYLGMDKNTRGSWYDKSTAPAGQTANASNSKRVYGQDGAMMTYAKITGDGQPVRDVNLISDYTENSTVNWAEWPEYVDSLEGRIESTGDAPHGYWNYNEENDHGAVTAGALLSPDPSKWNTKDVGQGTHDYIYLTVNVNDEEWHKVSIYVADCSGDRRAWFHQVRIMDMNKNPIAGVIANDYKDGIWYSFAVKGSFIMNIQQMPGTIHGVYSGIFFDPMMPETEAATYQKENLAATLEGARIVNLSWTNKKAAKTTIYRKEKGQPDSSYERIAYLENPNATAYRDESTQVAKEYTYKIGAGVANAAYPYITDYVLPGGSVDIKTAQYDLTSVTFERTDYSAGSVEDEIEVSVLAKKDVKYDGNGNITSEGQPYQNQTITFSLGGALVYDESQLEAAANMKVELGTAVTDSDGRATFAFSPEYAGEFEIIATVALWSNPEDETKGYDGSRGKAGLSIGLYKWESAPVMTTISDAIRPGETFTIMGTGLIPNDEFKVAIAPNKGVVDPAFAVSADLTYLTPLFTDSLYTSGVMLTMPKNLQPGIYDVWVKNSYGWSNGLSLNAARPLYISQEAAYQGLEIEIVGRNFFVDEFGMSESLRKEIKVKLVNLQTGGEKIIAPETGVRYTKEQSVTGAAIDESNPYRLTIVIPDSVSAGNYEIYVANDGINYRLLDGPQKLQIVDKRAGDANSALFGAGSGYDPLNLGVYWAQDLKYNAVEQMSAKDGNDKLDDTAAIQQKINTLASRGGGILYFNSGTYYASQIEMKDNVMLVGRGMNDTSLLIRQNSASFGTFITNPASNNGIARMRISLDLENGKAIPDMYLNFADNPDSSSDVDIRKHQNVFVKEVFLDMPYDVQDPYNGGSGSNRGLGILIGGKKNFVIDDNQFVGYFAVLHRGFVNEYVSLRNNIFKIQRDVMHCLASYTFVENTALLGNNNDGHGWSARNSCYFGNNYISKVGLVYPKANNNGEIIMLEVPGAQINYGSVLGVNVDENAITFDREKGVPMGNCDYNYFAVVITDGTGIGQVRYLDKNPIKDSADGKLNFGNSFKLREGEKPWDVVPDQSSLYAIYVPIENVTIYRNKAENCAKSILLYSQCHDAVVAENDLKNTDGISVYSTVGTTGTKGTNFFIRIERNRVEGVSVMTFKGGIGVMTERWTENLTYGGMLAGGVSIRYNTVLNTPSGNYVNMSEIPTTPGIYVHTKGRANVVEQVGDIRFTIVEGNIVDTSAYGVYIDNRAYCTVITRNEFKNIEADEDITNIGASDLIISSEFKFNLQGGTLQGGGDRTYLLNENLPTASKEGYTFWGWSKTQNYVSGSQPIKFAPSSSGTLYAIYGYNVDLMYNYEGNSNVYKTVVALPNEKIGDLPMPFRTDADFVGWYTDKECTKAFDGNSTVSGAYKLYAKWSDTASIGGEDKGKGCGGTLAGGIGSAALMLSVVCLAVFVSRKKRNNI